MPGGRKVLKPEVVGEHKNCIFLVQAWYLSWALLADKDLQPDFPTLCMESGCALYDEFYHKCNLKRGV